jgi:hypothetical protein
MRYRKLDSNGDYTFAQGSNTFVYDANAVAQAVETRLSLRQGTFWRDINDGLPLFQKILGQGAGTEAIKAIDSIYSSRISGTTGLRTLFSYSSSFDSRTRKYNYQGNADTIYSQTVPISGTF